MSLTKEAIISEIQAALDYTPKDDKGTQIGGSFAINAIIPRLKSVIDKWGSRTHKDLAASAVLDSHPISGALSKLTGIATAVRDEWIAGTIWLETPSPPAPIPPKIGFKLP